MSGAELVKNWKITVTLLERARNALPDLPALHEQEHAALLTQYREFLQQNELGLALDMLEELGHLLSARGGFWRDLERAAENMGLVDRLHLSHRNPGSGFSHGALVSDGSGTTFPNGLDALRFASRPITPFPGLIERAAIEG
jgi:hypothetical protein